jgi:hypothetical protein
MFTKKIFFFCFDTNLFIKIEYYLYESILYSFFFEFKISKLEKKLFYFENSKFLFYHLLLFVYFFLVCIINFFFFFSIPHFESFYKKNIIMIWLLRNSFKA